MTCIYCFHKVIENEPGSVYWIIEEERILWAHEECVQVYEGIKVQEYAWQFWR